MSALFIDVYLILSRDALEQREGFKAVSAMGFWEWALYNKSRHL